MAANSPVLDAELGQLPERISSHFDRVRDLVERETDGADDADACDRQFR